MPLPATIPVIVLADCNVFPHALLPLNIFEPRYCAMLRESLRNERFMAVAMLRDAEEEWGWDESDDNIHEFSCAGLLRACVGQGDGTSRLIMQGVRRIRFARWEQREPFRVARIEPVGSVVRDEKKARALAQQTLRHAQAFLPSEPCFARQFEKQFGELEDPEIIADVIGYNFLPCATLRQPLLGMECVEDRLKYILDYFGASAG